ncbi:MAG: Abi family protein [Atopobiaceae bacterium]|nr:Abi family protein [Atopobiaceae bacterium]
MSRKPWLNAAEQVEQLKEKGVRFNVFSESEAIEYLTKNSNYFRIRSYRTGFAKVPSGERQGEYANLDFAMLVDLSIVDMLLRYVMLPLTLDVEHFSKVRLLQQIENHGEDGYGVVTDFIASYDCLTLQGTIANSIKKEIDKGKSSPYASGILDKYPNYDFPVWAFIEVISFGTFCYFYKFCARRFNDKDMIRTFYMLQSVKGLRNACAHNNCIINDMKAGIPKYQVSNEVSQALGAIKGIGARQRQSKMNNDRFQQIVTTLYLNRMLASEGVLEHRSKSLAEFIERMNKHLDYYNGNTEVLSGFGFLTKVIEAWFPTKSESGC